jgi:methylenetetrahydrofolate--tRNA-(uracil-5-)-methyltransferase
MGLMAGIFISGEMLDKKISAPTHKTAIGALLHHITLGHEGIDFQPMNVNFGLFDPLTEKVKKADRKTAYSNQALEELEKWRTEFL